MAEEQDKGFVVIDRRGREAEGEAAAAKAATGERPASSAPPRALPRIDFSTFLISLSTSGFVHLGLVEDPETKQRPAPDLILARQVIDTLEILEEKTRGNLDAQEARLLESLLYELRMRFVEVGKGRA